MDSNWCGFREKRKKMKKERNKLKGERKEGKKVSMHCNVKNGRGFTNHTRGLNHEMVVVDAGNHSPFYGGHKPPLFKEARLMAQRTFNTFLFFYIF